MGRPRKALKPVQGQEPTPGPKRERDLNAYYLKRYGITVYQRDVMLVEQMHRCAVCGGENGGKTLNVDHDHKTGRVRGMLCFRCNKYFVGRQRDGRLLRSAADYLDRDYDARRIKDERSTESTASRQQPTGQGPDGGEHS